MNTKPLYIFDLDGTLADNTHRAHHLKKSPQDWTSFDRACGADTPILPMVELYHTLLEGGAEVRIWTGRTADVMLQTIEWLEKHELPCDELRMRKPGDWSDARVLKGMWLSELSEENRERLVCVFDDDPKMVEFWAAQGVLCLRVPK